jgi:hypothetical protein
LECGGVKPPHSKAPFGRKAVPFILGVPQAGLMLKARFAGMERAYSVFINLLTIGLNCYIGSRY